MKIGVIVRQYIPEVFSYCEKQDPSEFNRLQNPEYSKNTFDINYPFCKPTAQIRDRLQPRYWKQEYDVHGVRVRVSSQWFNPPISKSLLLFRQYLTERGIAFDAPLSSHITPATNEISARPTERAARRRYRGNAIGNAQNLLVRNILSRLGDESFSAADWTRVINDFDNRCAYCGADGSLLMDHVVSINKQVLGEHRLGNLVPSCRACNAKKADKDFREFLAHDPARIAAIEAHMAKHAYRPIGENEKLRQIIDRAHQDVRQLADRYIEIINIALHQDLRNNS